MAVIVYSLSIYPIILAYTRTSIQYTKGQHSGKRHKFHSCVCRKSLKNVIESKYIKNRKSFLKFCKTSNYHAPKGTFQVQVNETMDGAVHNWPLKTETRTQFLCFNCFRMSLPITSKGCGKVMFSLFSHVCHSVHRGEVISSNEAPPPPPGDKRSRRLSCSFVNWVFIVIPISRHYSSSWCRFPEEDCIRNVNCFAIMQVWTTQWPSCDA